MTKPHKFFERYLPNDLNDLTNYLLFQSQRIENGEIVSGSSNNDSPWESGHSESTNQWFRYNVFQFYHPGIHALFKAVRDMTKEACEYYDIDFKAQNYYAQSWFNVNYSNKGKLEWHDHGGDGAPAFHGYYCVKAEPSLTHYKLPDGYMDNINKDNRAILSETGHPHAMADWDWDGPRITIAYDVCPIYAIEQAWEQHWVPLC